MDGEYRPEPKRDRAKTVADAKARIKGYVAAGIPQGLSRYFAKLEAEKADHQ